MKMNYKEKVSYKIDKQNIIVEIFDDWVNAAKIGKADYLIDTNNVLGTKIFSYVMGDSTRMYYDVIFQKCRLLNKPHTIDYRCDSPTHMRYMQMQIVPKQLNSLYLYNFLLKEEPFQKKIIITDSTHNCNTGLISRCSICNSLKFHINGEWIPPESLKTKNEEDFLVIHTVCPKCKNVDWRKSNWR